MDYPTIIIGKAGVTNSLIAEIKARLKKHRKVRVKMLKSARSREKKEVAEEVAEKTRSKLADLRGYTFILTK